MLRPALENVVLTRPLLAVLVRLYDNLHILLAVRVPLLLVTFYHFVATLRILNLSILYLADVRLLLLSLRILMVHLFVIDDVLPFGPLALGRLLSLLPLFSLSALCPSLVALTFFGLKQLGLRYNLFTLLESRQSLVPFFFFLLLLLVLLLCHPLYF